MPELELAVSATTRQPRLGETQGVHYHFLDEAEFAAPRSRRATSSSTPSTPAAATARCAASWTSGIAEGHSVVLEIEVQGARQIAQTMPEAVRIFIAPPDESTLLNRLIGRDTDTREEIDRRLQVAKSELAAQDEFAHVVDNDRLDDAIDELQRVVSRM